MLKLLDYAHELTVDRYLTYQVPGELRQHMQDQGQKVAEMGSGLYGGYQMMRAAYPLIRAEIGALGML